MSGAAWNPKKKSLEEEWYEQVIMKPEYYDLDIPTIEEYIRQQYKLIKGTDKEPAGMCGHWSWRIQTEKEYKKLYNK
jgi:hypothetical protein